ncbi:hypothetical protein OG345_40770 (plasmid) [Streptomyces sp. NBC_01220]|uniref:hypothetical protein n=1 Tax=Streptomyces sp. NBC_01220 TaxID=2903781 RepID=UPI002F911E0C|nr:hypothetical protein OG345_40770 [Streptomyces sp. NBC_01220]
MNRLLRRLLGMGPSPAVMDRAALEHLGRQMADGFAKGLQDPRPLTPEETAHVMAHSGAVARRSFSTLYDDEV